MNPVPEVFKRLHILDTPKIQICGVCMKNEKYQKDVVQIMDIELIGLLQFYHVIGIRPILVKKRE